MTSRIQGPSPEPQPINKQSAPFPQETPKEFRKLLQKKTDILPPPQDKYEDLLPLPQNTVKPELELCAYYPEPSLGKPEVELCAYRPNEKHQSQAKPEILLCAYYAEKNKPKTKDIP